METNSFQPLNEIWDIYTESIDEAVAQGYIADEEMAEQYLWPDDLHIAASEQDDVKRYVHERMSEIVERIKADRGLDPNLLAAILFRSVLVSMMWERERIGR